MPKKMDVNSKAEAARSAAEKRAEAATRKAENRRLAEAEAACVAAPPRCRVLPAAVGGCCGLRGAARPVRDARARPSGAAALWVRWAAGAALLALPLLVCCLLLCSSSEQSTLKSPTPESRTCCSAPSLKAPSLTT